MSERVRSQAIVRPLGPTDRDSVRAILIRTGYFTAVEVSTALELVDDWLSNGEASGYLCFVAADTVSAAIRGYVCVGPAPLTDGTYDLYWIAVDPDTQGRGIGQQLLAFAEDDVRRRGGRLLLIETSSQEIYQSTVRFYERCGYTLVARIAEYYRAGDDKLVFGKYLEPPVASSPSTTLGGSPPTGD
jgi:ribosomal protein S18 acetylase RimI-like enzyme